MIKKTGKKDSGKDKETKSIPFKIVERERKDKDQLPTKIIIVDPRDKESGKDKKPKIINVKMVERERKDKDQLPTKIIIVDPRDKEHEDESLLPDETVVKNTGSQQGKTGNNKKRKGTNKKR